MLLACCLSSPDSLSRNISINEHRWAYSVVSNDLALLCNTVQSPHLLSVSEWYLE